MKAIEFYYRQISEKFFVPDGKEVSIIPGLRFNGCYYVRWSDQLQDSCYVDSKRVSYILKAIAFDIGEASHSYSAWSVLRKKLIDLHC